MKVLVFSDSHSGLTFMRNCIKKLRPDAVIHLGDYFDDGEVMAQEYPHLTFYQVKGNCDKYRAPIFARSILCLEIGGAMLYMTHGHKHFVKTGIYSLLADARAAKAQAALYGHTHIPDCHQEEDGLWVLNPGSCGSSGGSAGILGIKDKKITACYLVKQSDLEETL